MTRLRVVAILAAALLLAACISQPPLTEVRLVVKSFNDLNSASQPMLDDLRWRARTGKKGRGNTGGIADGAAADRQGRRAKSAGAKGGDPRRRMRNAAQTSFFMAVKPRGSRRFRTAFASRTAITTPP